MSAIDGARFATGLTYDEYKAQMTRNRDRVDANEARVTIDPKDLEAFRSINGPVHVLALADTETVGDAALGDRRGNQPAESDQRASRPRWRRDES